MNNFVRSPVIRYGGKNKMQKYIIPYFPQVDTIISPFLGAGHIELKYAAKNIQIIGNDIDPYLINTWKHFQENRDELINLLTEEFINISEEHWREIKYEYQNNIIKNNLIGAAKYIALSRVCYSGILSKDIGFSKHKQSYFNINLINSFKKVKYKPFILSNQDWYDFLRNQDKEAFIYLDPPYYGVNRNYLYNFNKTDHEELRGFLETRPNWVLSYKYHPDIIEMYKGYKIINIDFHNYTYNRYKSNNVSANEILILSQ